MSNCRIDEPQPLVPFAREPVITIHAYIIAGLRHQACMNEPRAIDDGMAT